MRTQNLLSAFRLPVALAAIGIASGLASAQTATPEPTTAPAPATETSSDFATAGGDPYAMGEKVIFAQIGLGGFGYYGTTSFPLLTVGMDYGFHKYMTLGGTFSYTSSSQDYSVVKYTYSYTSIAFRGTFHPTMWMKKVKIPLDPYGAASLGYTILSTSSTGSGSNIYRSSGNNSIYPGFAVGARYWFAPNFAGQAETGLGRALLDIGIAYKF